MRTVVIERQVIRFSFVFCSQYGNAQNDIEQVWSLKVVTLRVID